MAGDSGEPSLGEETQLLTEETRTLAFNGSPKIQNGSAETSGEESEGLSEAYQQMGMGRGLLIVLSLWILIFLQASNISIISTTQSRIAEDLSAFDSASWFTSTYLIAMSSMSPILARLAQIFSPRNCILVTALLFSIGGIIASQAQNLSTFLLGRAVSGVGGAGILAISFILVLDLATKKKRGLYIGLINAGVTIGVSLGAVIAGLLLPLIGWRPLFGAQCPLGVIAGIGIFFSLPTSFNPRQKETGDDSIRRKLAKLDYFGALTLTATIVSFLFGLSFHEVLWVPIAVSAILLPIFVIIEVYVASDPIIPVAVLKSRGALFSCIGQLGSMSARYTVLFYTPMVAIAVRGWSPASAGSILIPTNLGFAIGGIMVGWLHVKRPGSFWGASMISYFLFAMTFLVLSKATSISTPAPLYFLIVFLNGLCTGASLNYTFAHLLHLTPPSTHFISTTLLTTFRGFAASFGAAIGGGLFIRLLKRELEMNFEEHGGLKGKEYLVRRLLGSPALVQSLVGDEKLVAVESYESSLKVLFLAAGGLAILMVLVQASTGWKAGIEKESSAATGYDLVNGDDGDGEDWEEGMEQGA